jgi:hypothetical protein
MMTGKASAKRLQMTNFWLGKSPSAICSEWVREIACGDLESDGHHFLAFIVYR